MSERTFRRYRDRFEAAGAEGLYDRRLGRVSARRAGVDEVMAVLELFDTGYRDFTAKHFWEKLVSDHGFRRSYTWVRLTLRGHGRIRPAASRVIRFDPAHRPISNRSGQFIWYINRSTQFVIDSRNLSPQRCGIFCCTLIGG